MFSSHLEKEAESQMRVMARILDRGLNPHPKRVKRWGFVVVAFKFGDVESVGYISNAKHEDMIVALKRVSHTGDING